MKTVNRICWTCKSIDLDEYSGCTCGEKGQVEGDNTCDKWELAGYILVDVVEDSNK